MTIAVFAIDTTGLYRFDKAGGDDQQPRIVAMAGALFNNKWRQKTSFDLITKSDGSISAAGAKDVHGVSERERALYGVDSLFMLAGFMRYVRLADEVCIFNMKFGRAVLESEMIRLKANYEDWTRGGLKKTCIGIESAARWNDGKHWNISAAHAAATGIAYDPPADDRHIHNLRAAVRILIETRQK